MSRAIYFSRIQYMGGEVGGNRKFILLLDIKEKKIKYQITEQKQGRTQVMETYKKELSTGWMNQILPLCNVGDFEQHISNAENESAGWGVIKNCIGYRDGVSITFCGIIASGIPEVEMEMKFLYDKQHEPPHEKLYQFLLQNFLLKDKNLKQYIFR